MWYDLYNILAHTVINKDVTVMPNKDDFCYSLTQWDILLMLSGVFK